MLRHPTPGRKNKGTPGWGIRLYNDKWFLLHHFCYSLARKLGR